MRGLATLARQRTTRRAAGGLVGLVLILLMMCLVMPPVASAYRPVVGGARSSQSAWATDGLYGVASTDALRGWAVGEYGTILATTDGGTAWSLQRSEASETLFDADFSDATHGWAVGKDRDTGAGVILATTDGGASWARNGAGWKRTDFVGVASVDDTHCSVVGNSSAGGLILTTGDGGATWSATKSKSIGEFTGVAFADATHGWTVGVSYRKATKRWTSVILATADGGVTWRRQHSIGEYLVGIAFGDASHGWAATADGTVLFTTDGGATWRRRAVPGGEYLLLSAVACSGASGFRAVGTDGRTGAGAILATADGGATWGTQRMGSHDDLRGVAFSDADHGWVVGGLYDQAYGSDIGVILATTDAGVSWARQSPSSISRLKPASGKRGVIVIITGTGFGATQAASSVQFGSSGSTEYLAWSDGEIQCRIPADAPYRALYVTVTTALGTSNSVRFTVKR
jgi:photosystem II stability/assembly factor-like uncharacterized protein